MFDYRLFHNLIDWLNTLKFDLLVATVLRVVRKWSVRSLIKINNQNLEKMIIIKIGIIYNKPAEINVLKIYNDNNKKINNSTLCQPYKCICGASVDTRAGLTLSFLHTQSMTIATPSLRQRPDMALLIEGRILFHLGTIQGLLRSDGKRPDGLTFIHWREGRCATWDITFTDTVAASYLNAASCTAGSAAEAATSRKKYAAV